MYNVAGQNTWKFKINILCLVQRFIVLISLISMHNTKQFGIKIIEYLNNIANRLQ